MRDRDITRGIQLACCLKGHNHACELITMRTRGQNNVGGFFRCCESRFVWGEASRD